MLRMKPCPFCAASIQNQAIACGYCGRDLPPGPAVASKWNTRFARPAVLGGLALALLATAVIAYVASENGSAEGTRATPEASVPEAPIGLSASKASTSSITLSWALPSSEVAPKSVEIFRDGNHVAYVDASQTEFTDTGLDPASRHTYWLVVVTGTGGSLVSTSLAANTGAPPVTASRLEGSYEVLYTVTASNFQQPGDSLRFFWNISPRCPAGPCSGQLRIPMSPGPAAVGVVRRFGGSYEVQINEATLGSSGSHDDPPQDSILATIYVTEARMVGGQWTAASFEGVFKEYLPPPRVTCRSGYLRCSLGYLRANVRGSILG